MFVLIALFITSAILLISYALIPLIIGKMKAWEDKKEKSVSQELDKMFYDKNPRNMVRLYFVLPPVLAGLIFFFSKSLLFAAAAGVLGLLIPNFILRVKDQQRRQKFNNQILDAIMVISSSLKGGLSLLQVLEAVSEMMPNPMSQEMGLVVRENKMGMTLEQSLRRLQERMYSEELNSLVNAVLIARETGGDLVKVLGRLSVTIRDNRKLKDNIKTLTMQGRLQGLIMSALPFLFISWVLSFNREHFNIMLQNELGRTLLFAAVILQVLGMILIRKFSQINI